MLLHFNIVRNAAGLYLNEASWCRENWVCNRKFIANFAHTNTTIYIAYVYSCSRSLDAQSLLARLITGIYIEILALCIPAVSKKIIYVLFCFLSISYGGSRLINT